MRYFIASIPFALGTFAAPSPAPKSTSLLCGPSSNCEIISDEDGAIGYRFKRGLEPGTLDYSARFEPRDLGSQKRDAEISTFVTLGKTKMDWGCDQPLDVIFEGLREICGQHGCDEGTAFSKEISWAGPGNFMNSPQPRTLQLHASGSFFGEKDRDIYIDAFKATATPETVGTEDRAWCKPTSNPRLGSCREVGSCPMRIFPNFIKIARFEGENLKDHIDVNVSTEGSNLECLAEKQLSAIGGAISPIAGGFFGVASACCESDGAC